VFGSDVAGHCCEGDAAPGLNHLHPTADAEEGQTGLAGVPEKGAFGLVALGRVAHDSVVAALGRRAASAPFAHGALHALDGLALFDSYHCSRYNTNTGVLTADMFRALFAQARSHLDAASQASASAAL